MGYTEKLKSKLIQLAEEINSNPGCNIEFNQQDITKKNMSFTGGNGTIYVEPFHSQYDIVLSGASLEKQFYGFMRELCGRDHDGYKQTNKNKGTFRAPYWRVSDFKLVKKAVHNYAKTRK